MLACEAGAQYITEELLSHGGDATLADSHGNTAFHFAMKRGHAHLIRMLLSHRADPYVENKDGLSPISFAEEAGSDVKERVMRTVRAFDAAREMEKTASAGGGGTG